jgi:hypothetical protein
MTLIQARQRCAYWQGRLNLREWKISLQWGKSAESRECHGRCWWNCEELTATVELNKYSREKEATLVHELLHIVWQGHTPVPEVGDVQLERAINRITTALISQ